jgi:MFS family permease
LPSPRALQLAILAVTLSLSYGIWYSYSVVLVALLHEFGWARSVLAGAFSVFTLAHGSSSPLLGALCERVRPPAMMAAGGCALGLALFANSFISAPWHLYLGFGVFTAVAVCSAGWTPALVQVQRNFQDRLGLALGIVGIGIMGAAVGSALGPWFAGFLFDRTGTYFTAFAVAAGCGIAAGAACWRARALRVRVIRA